MKENIIVIVEFFKNCINFRDKNVSFEEHHWMASSKFIIDINKIFSIKEIKDDSPSNTIKRLSWRFYAPLTSGYDFFFLQGTRNESFFYFDIQG